MDSAFIEKYIYYLKFGCEWNLGDMLWINKCGFIISDLLDSEKQLEAIVIFITAGINKHSSKKAKDIIVKFSEKFGDVDVLAKFIIIDLCEKHGFIKFNTYDDEPINPLLKDIFEKVKEKEQLSHDKALEKEKKHYQYTINCYIDAGYKVEDILKMDMSNYEYIENYYIDKREQVLNDALLVIHRLGLLTGVGVNSIKNYPEEADVIHLRPKTKQEIIEDMQAKQKAFFDSIHGQ